MTDSRSSDILEHLSTVLAGRKASGDPAVSYTARLFQGGAGKIHRKVMEEAFEVTAAHGEGGNAKLVAELADLWFHTLVLMAHHGVTPAEVLAELARRGGISGLEEKAARGG